MELLLTLFTAGAASLAIVPLMMRLAPRLGMVDQPSSRKVHAYPIPRVGGWGIVLGALVAILVWAPFDELVLCYIFGVVVLFAFGAWDDRKELGHYTKFIGQLVAISPVVFIAGLCVVHFPFVGPHAVPTWAAMAFTVFALIGMTNAINHSDGLDGLAGGEAVLSLVAIGLLAYLAKGDLTVLIAFSVIGGVFGFLRYNTHPAVVFMGDSGSQVIGFSLGVLAVLLTQRTAPDLSPTVVLLLLGLPVADILYVFYRRIREGRNWFLATRNHVHHRLMDRGFTHNESVLIIYSIQIAFVASGLVLRHQSDALILGVYLGGCGAIFSWLYLAERNGWRVTRAHARRLWPWLAQKRRQQLLLVEAPRRFFELSVPLYLVLASLGTTYVPHEFGVGSVIVFLLLAANLIVIRDPRAISRRALLFCAAALVVYLSFRFPVQSYAWLEPAHRVYLGILAAALLTAIRFSPGRREFEFRATAMDYLIIFVVVISLLAVGGAFQASVGSIIGLLVLVYVIELMLSERRQRRQGVGVASLIATAILAAKGLM
jgi:UDP-GlcNAc:undecaprenyl-phosphate GlcNAc-1-phosphate transferase